MSLKNKQKHIEDLISYVMDNDHEFKSYMEHCKDSGSNPLFIHENEHIYTSALLLQKHGSVGNAILEIIEDDGVSDRDILELAANVDELDSNYRNLVDFLKDKVYDIISEEDVLFKISKVDKDNLLVSSDFRLVIEAAELERVKDLI